MNDFGDAPKYVLSLGSMKILIVEKSADLAQIWQRHLERQGLGVDVASDQASAIDYLQENAVDLIILDLVLDQGSAFAIADYANYRHPQSRVIFTTNSSFFSDGSIFQHVENACAFLPKKVDPQDLAAMAEHFAAAS